MVMTRPTTDTEWVSPIGRSIDEDIAEALATSPEYRAAWRARRPQAVIARRAILRRGELGLTRAEVAARMGTSVAVVSRIENGQHPTSIELLRRLAEALDMRLVLGFETGPADDPVRDVAAV
jgi:HTH-type transcriptional regulator/antitoxin HipB